MTPLLTALSSLRPASWASVLARSRSPSASASRTRRVAVRSELLTAFTLVRLVVGLDALDLGLDVSHGVVLSFGWFVSKGGTCHLPCLSKAGSAKPLDSQHNVTHVIPGPWVVGNVEL